MQPTRRETQEDAMSESERLTITFRCPPELEASLPKPFPAVQGLPGWFKDMPQKAYSELLQGEQFTVKKCPPFIDAMAFGFLIPLVTDIHIEDGVFTWDREVPAGSLMGSMRSPLDFHENLQVLETPFFKEDRFLIKFNGFWTIETPPGYSLLITHPLNRGDLPFETLTGLVDADLYRDNFTNFPAQWRDENFNGVLAKGTPIAQCIPIRRDSWNPRFEPIAGDAVNRMHNLQWRLSREKGIYRREFRARKR